MDCSRFSPLVFATTLVLSGSATALELSRTLPATEIDRLPDQVRFLVFDSPDASLPIDVVDFGPAEYKLEASDGKVTISAELLYELDPQRIWIETELDNQPKGERVAIAVMSPSITFASGNNLNMDGNVITNLDMPQAPDDDPLDVVNRAYVDGAVTAGGDNLGNHIAGANIQLNGFWLSGDGNSDGIQVVSDGKVLIQPTTGSTSPDLKVEGVDGVLFTGTYDSGSFTPPSGAGTRFMWYPKKGALRAGIVSIAQWDDANIGDYSTAMGAETTASGYSSTAMGLGATASGWISTAMGANTTASGSYSTAMGGDFATASGDNSTAIGFGTTASGNGSTAMGWFSTAESAYETAIGRWNTDYTPGSTTGWDNGDRLFVIGNGTSTSTRSDAMVVLKNGNTTINGDISADNNNRGTCSWTAYFSEEDPAKICPSGRFVAGMQCEGSYCNNVKLYCCAL